MAENPEAKRPSSDRRRRTRAAILDAASGIVSRTGYDRMSMEDVARGAGITRRTVYAHFKNKDDLIIELAKRRAPPIAPKPKPGMSFADHMREVGKAVAEAAPEREKNAIAAASLQLYVLTHPEMMRRARAESAKIYDMIEQGVRAQWQPHEMPMSAHHFVRIVHALTDGLLMHRALRPAETTDDVIMAAFEALAPPSPAGRRKR